MVMGGYLVTCRVGHIEISFDFRRVQPILLCSLLSILLTDLLMIHGNLKVNDNTRFKFTNAIALL